MWIIYYDDKSTFDSTQGEPKDAPAWGVQVIAQEDDLVGRYFIQGHNYYWWLRGYWVGGDRDGLLDYLAHNGPGPVRMGRGISPREYRAIVQKATEEEDGLLPRKSGRLQSEKRN